MQNNIRCAIAFRCCACLAMLLSSTVTAVAQTDHFPSKPIRVLVGYSAGSTVDVAPRAIAAKLVESWKQQVLVDNRPSAGGIIAAQTVAGANPDGYTLLSVSASHAVAPAIYSKLPYDTVRDFAGITKLAHAAGIKATY